MFQVSELFQFLRLVVLSVLVSVKYLGLLAMSRILQTHPKSVQTHKDLILQCLDDKDESIRVRALNLLYGMVSIMSSLPCYRSVRVAERLALSTSDHGVAGSNPAGSEILPEPKRRFIAQSLSCSPFHRLEMTEILLKGRKTLTHLSIFHVTVRHLINSYIVYPSVVLSLYCHHFGSTMSQISSKVWASYIHFSVHEDSYNWLSIWPFHDFVPS